MGHRFLAQPGDLGRDRGVVDDRDPLAAELRCAPPRPRPRRKTRPPRRPQSGRGAAAGHEAPPPATLAHRVALPQVVVLADHDARAVARLPLGEEGLETAVRGGGRQRTGRRAVEVANQGRRWRRAVSGSRPPRTAARAASGAPCRPRNAPPRRRLRRHGQLGDGHPRRDARGEDTLGLAYQELDLPVFGTRAPARSGAPSPGRRRRRGSRCRSPRRARSPPPLRPPPPRRPRRGRPGRRPRPRSAGA